MLGVISDSSYNKIMLDAVTLIQQAGTHAENAGGCVRDGERTLAPPPSRPDRYVNLDATPGITRPG